MSEPGRIAECVGGPLDGDVRTCYRPGKGFIEHISKGEWGGLYVLDRVRRLFVWKPRSTSTQEPSA